MGMEFPCIYRLEHYVKKGDLQALQDIWCIFLATICVKIPIVQEQFNWPYNGIARWPDFRVTFLAQSVPATLTALTRRLHFRGLE